LISITENATLLKMILKGRHKMKKTFAAILSLMVFLAPNSTFAEKKSISVLSQKCIDVLTPAAASLGMTLKDLEDPKNSEKLREHYIKKEEWKKIRSACHPGGKGLLDACRNGWACVPFVTPCWYDGGCSY
jgi:hypothetical protein